MPARTTFRSPSHRDAAILTAFKNIAAELGQNSKQCRITVVVMDGYPANEDILLSEIQSQPFVRHAEQHRSASWERAWIHFKLLHLEVRLDRDRNQGDDLIIISFRRDPSDPADVSRSLTAVQGQFVPLNRAAAIERALGPEMAEFYRLREEGLSRLETLTHRLTRETHNYRMRLDAEIEERKRALTESFEERNQALHATYEKRNWAMHLTPQSPYVVLGS